VCFKLVSWNLNGRTNNIAAVARRNWLLGAKPNILVMPHPPATRGRLEADLTGLGLQPHRGVWSDGADGRHGLGVVGDQPFVAVQQCLYDRNLQDVSLHRFTHVTVGTGKQLHILGVYVPLFRPDGSLKRAYTDALLHYLETQKLHMQNTIIAGDFNLVRNPANDMEKPTSWPWQRWELDFMESLAALGFVDVCQPVGQPMFTWRSKYGYRLDYIFVSQHLREFCTGAGIDPTAMGTIAAGKGSDHAPIYVECELGAATR
jgi:exonuclease III